MRLTEHTDVTDGPWAPYRPDEASPWNLRRVVHLHRRAGFAANWADLQRDLAEGPEKSIGRLLNGRCEPLGGASPEEFERTSTLLADSAVAAGELGASEGLVVLPDALLARSAGRAADPDVAQPLRHRQFQGRRPGRHAAPERALPPPGSRTVRRAARRGGPRSRPPGLARRPRQSQGAPQREPRPRVDGAVQPGHRPLQRGRRQGRGPGADRLDRGRRRLPHRSRPA